MSRYMIQKIILLVLWIAAVMWLCSIALDMVSAPNTVENLIGSLLLIAGIVISIKTKCFTTIPKLWKTK